MLWGCPPIYYHSHRAVEAVEALFICLICAIPCTLIINVPHSAPGARTPDLRENSSDSPLMPSSVSSASVLLNQASSPHSFKLTLPKRFIIQRLRDGGTNWSINSVEAVLVCCMRRRFVHAAACRMSIQLVEVWDSFANQMPDLIRHCSGGDHTPKEERVWCRCRCRHGIFR
jgi:hypothetical protein